MKTPLSSFIVHLSSFALLLAFGNAANAQWIIDGQQTQVLKLDVSDPQALYTDGSREMTAPLVFASSLTATSGMARATIPWDTGETDFFVVDEVTEALKLADTGNIGLKIGTMILRETSLEQTDEGTSIDMQGHMLSGGWLIDEVLPYDEAIINRGYADACYLPKNIALAPPLVFSSALTATSGLFRAYNEWNQIYEDLLIYDAGSELIKLGDCTTGLQIGSLKVEQYKLTQPDTGHTISFEEGLLFGSWGVFGDPDTDYGIVGRGYADSRYLRADTPSAQPLKFAQSLTATNGALQIYSSDNADHLGYFKTLSFQDGLQFCTEGSAALFFGSGDDGLLVGTANISQLEYGKQINFETGELTGSAGAKEWHVASDPIEASGIVSKGYADSHYVLRSQGITTNRVIQAGDTLVISNGVITAINP